MVKAGIKKAERRWPLLAVAALIPLLLSLLFSYFAARSLVHRQMDTTANSLINQADRLSDRAWDMVNLLRRFENQPCTNVVADIQRYGTLYAYFRSVGLMQNDEITCSSAYGPVSANLSQMIRRPVPVIGKAWWSLSIAGTYGVPDRPAVLFIRHTPGGFGTYAVIDAQYLIDLMNTVAQPHGDQLSVQVGEGFVIRTGGVQPESHLLWGNSLMSKHSARFPITVSVASSSAEFFRVWRQLLFTFMPLGLILALVCTALASNWLKRKHSFRDEIRRGMARGEFLVVYQPVYSTAKGTIGGAEALLRWQRSNGEWVSPDVFITAAEAEGMIVPLTRHLLDLIVRDSLDWTLPPAFHLGLNVAADHLQDPGFCEDIRRFAEQLTMHRLNITLELTERSLIGDPETVVGKLADLRREGMRIAIDDFGTGHCTLSYLQTFPLDYLKIDKGFVTAIEALDRETPILDTIISLSEKLALETVAEGVETPLQLAYLQQRGVAYIQGYLYARPMRSSEMMAWLAQPPAFPPIAQD